MTTRADIERRIKRFMDHLQLLMESNAHLDRKNYVLDVCDQLNKYFTAMSDDDKEYLQIARSAVEQGRKWNV